VSRLIQMMIFLSAVENRYERFPCKWNATKHLCLIPFHWQWATRKISL